MLYVDLDHVLADFDAGYERAFGCLPDWTTTPVTVDWPAIAAHPTFWRKLPLMPDAPLLWEGVRRHNPYILTSKPPSDNRAARGKIRWVRQHLETDRIIVCDWPDKAAFCYTGDILIDNWDRVCNDWTAAGGVAIQHTSAADTLRTLDRIMRTSYF
jgi:5'-nucleotidase